MFLKNKIRLVIFSLVLGSFGCVNAQDSNRSSKLNKKDIAEENNKDTVFYEINSTIISQTKYEEIYSKIREFIWTHWKNKKNGLLTLRGINKHGEIYISTYDIKKAENENWIIVAERKKIKTKDLSNSNNLLNINSKDEVKFTALEVDRIETPKDSLAKAKVIPSNVIRSSNLYRIRLKEKNGKILQEL